MNRTMIAMSGNTIPGNEPFWEFVVCDVHDVYAKDLPLSPQDEQFMLRILNFNGKLRCRYGKFSTFEPYSNPENVLKSLAIQCLGQCGTKHLLRINQARKTNTELAKVATDTIQKIIFNNVIKTADKLELEDYTFKVVSEHLGRATVYGNVFGLRIWLPANVSVTVGQTWKLALDGNKPFFERINS